jgi:hypothetical protein
MTASRDSSDESHQRKVTASPVAQDCDCPGCPAARIAGAALTRAQDASDLSRQIKDQSNHLYDSLL